MPHRRRIISAASDFALSPLRDYLLGRGYLRGSVTLDPVLLYTNPDLSATATNTVTALPAVAMAGNDTRIAAPQNTAVAVKTTVKHYSW